MGGLGFGLDGAGGKLGVLVPPFEGCLFLRVSDWRGGPHPLSDGGGRVWPLAFPDAGRL